MVAIAVLAVSILNFRFLLYPLFPNLNPINDMKHIRLVGKILFISDLHLRDGRGFEFADVLRAYVESNQISNLVVVGDLFDSRDDSKKILGNHQSFAAVLNLLGLDGLGINVFWVTGSPAHDPTDVEHDHGVNEGIVVLGRCGLFSYGHLRILAYHGHDISAMGAIGHAWSRFIANLSLERLWKRLAKVDNSPWVIFGHTHVPGLDTQYRVANCGGWMRVPVLVNPSGTGILFSSDQEPPQLVQILNSGSG